MECRGGEVSIERKEIAILFFDLPMETGTQQRAYRIYRKFLKGNGYLQVQKSADVRVFRNGRNIGEELERVKRMFPAGGSLYIMPVGIGVLDRIVSAGEGRIDFGQLLADVVFL